MSDLEDLLEEQWSNYRVEPSTVWICVSFGVIAVSKKGYRLVEYLSDDGRELTSDELAQFEAEYPSLFK